MIKPGAKHYVIKEDDGVVVAIGNEIYPEQEASDARLNLDEKWLLSKVLSNNTRYDNIYRGKGVARCSDDDAFDVNTGKIIASAKADKQLHRQMVHCYDETIRQLENVLAETKRLKACHEDKIRRCEDVIDAYCRH